MYFVPLHTSSIDEHAPLVSTLRVTECYWWIDDDGHIGVALRAEPYGPFMGTVWVSLDLEEPPAGSAREYQLGRTGLSAFYSLQSLPRARFRSFRGIAAIWPQPDGTLRGRVRAWAQHRHFTMLMGWRAASQVLITFEFQATENVESGQRLRADSQPDRWATSE